jgi:hypothetical protein
MSEVIEKKKRGRRKKDVVAEPETAVAKKRGRKPKGGKLVVKQSEADTANAAITNVILHLKCSLNDLTDRSMSTVADLVYNPDIPPEVKTYTTENDFCEYEDSKAQPTNYAYTEPASNVTICKKCASSNDSDVNMKDVNSKLKSLKFNLYKDMLKDHKAACFWCTYEYDNPSCYIPKYEMNDTLHGYGSFCRPECAVAYLMKENIDDSTKFERYHLLNQIYSKVYDYKKNIKPAPDPHYLLDKFFGNLSIQEYRKLLKTEHLLLVIDKPMTRVMPELFEDNDNFILDIYGDSNATVQNSASNSMYKVKRQSEKQPGPSKNSIIRDKFGM